MLQCRTVIKWILSQEIVSFVDYHSFDCCDYKGVTLCSRISCRPTGNL